MIADFLGVILALAIVLVVAWFSLRLLARMQAAASGPGGGPATLRFLRALPVGARERLGGTWDLFRYPGIRSDSDMHTLGFSFAPKAEA